MVRSEKRVDRPRRYSGAVHREHEQRDPLLTAVLFRGSCCKHAPISYERIRSPNLLPGYPPTLAVGHGPCSQASQVRSRLGFAEALAPNHVAIRDARQVKSLLLGGAESHDGRTHPVESHVLGTPWLVIGPHLLANDGLLPNR